MIRVSGVNDLVCLSDTLCSAAPLWTDCRSPFVTMVADGHYNKGTCSRSVPAIKSFLLEDWCVRACVCVCLSCHCDGDSRPCHVSAGSIICASVFVFETCLTAFLFVGSKNFFLFLFSLFKKNNQLAPSHK